QGKQRELVKETSDAPSPAKQAKAGKVTKKRMPKSSLQFVDEFFDEGVPEKEPAHDDEERLTPMPTKSFGHAESPSLDEELALTDSEMESDKEAPEIHAGDQDEGQAGSNPGESVESQPQSSHVVHAGPNLEHMDSEATDEKLKLPTEDQVILKEPASSTRTLSSLQNLDKELSFTNQFFIEKPQEEEPEKTNIESEVQSMVTVPILQDTSSVPSMTSPVINLTVSHPVSTTIHTPLPTLTATVITTTTTTSLQPPPPQPQQSTTDPILVRRIGELEQHMADLV
ncbi:hypothetical protein Tco_1426779, partial [Tanacetum coccineum]